MANPPEEVAYFVTKARQVAILCSSAAVDLVSTTTQELSKSGISVPYVNIGAALANAPKLSLNQIVVASDRYLDDNAAGVVIFTSGTTGRPKGSVLRRAYIHESALGVADSFDIRADDVVLHTLPVHHATGLGTSFFPFLNSGACIEFRTSTFDPTWVWNRFRAGGCTIFSGVPTMYLRLMWHFQKAILSRPAAEQLQYTEGVRRLRSCLCGSSALQQPVQDFWTNMRGGQPILVRYGSSEIPGCIRVPARVDPSTVPRGCVGSTAPGVDVKISDDGELLIKSPHMFSKYLHDKEATRGAHDAEGWFRTGDICRKEGDYYFIIGRASVDIIKSGGYKIGAPEVESVMLGLPYISEAAVVGVEDDEYGQRVGAIITLKQSQISLTIQRLRDDMRKLLPAYKLPTLLRIVEGELPKGQTGKVQKKTLGLQLFPVPRWKNDPHVQMWTRRKTPLKAQL